MVEWYEDRMSSMLECNFTILNDEQNTNKKMKWKENNEGKCV